MSIRLHFCHRCQRPIPPGRSYCEDCEAFLQSPLTGQLRCSHCGKVKSAGETLLFNRKLNKVYCITCLNIFRLELSKQGMNDVYIRKIIREDFREV